MTKTFPASILVLIVGAICASLLLAKMHQNAVDNSGLQIARCVDQGKAAGAVYAHTFYTRPILIAWRCVQG